MYLTCDSSNPCSIGCPYAPTSTVHPLYGRGNRDIRRDEGASKGIISDKFNTTTAGGEPTAATAPAPTPTTAAAVRRADQHSGSAMDHERKYAREVELNLVTERKLGRNEELRERLPRKTGTSHESQPEGETRGETTDARA